MNYKSLALLFFLVALSGHLSAQKKGNNHLAFTYRFGGFNDRLTDDITHKERNHILDLAYWINNEYALVGSANIIQSNFTPAGTDLETANVYSLSIRRNFLQRSKHQLYLGLGGSTGDYCTCDEGLPRKRKNLLYWRYELGFDLYLQKNIGLGVHLQSSNILDRVPDKYSYTVLALSASIALR